jgi:hypothetical protein
MPADAFRIALGEADRGSRRSRLGGRSAVPPITTFNDREGPATAYDLPGRALEA